MGCHTWTYKDKKSFENQVFRTTEHPFLFRVFDYQEDVLTSYEQAEKFVLETLKNSTNNKPKISTDRENTFLTYTAEMRGKILLASENGDDELEDPTLTLKRLKDFYEKYPDGVIVFG